MEEKERQKILKIQALAERGVGGEKTTAERMLRKLLAKNGISSLEELEADKEVQYYLFSYHGKHEIKLLEQCIYKVLTEAGDRTCYRSHGKREKLGVYCTKAQKIEIDLEFDFYRKVFYEELEVFMIAFIQKQHIFPPDVPTGKCDDEKHMRALLMTGGIKKKSRTGLIEEK
ncbi:MAG: hypothetical protein LUC98_07610 [Lachnospiraceae bacterium]|nr:hypothetical protein [Lachnospiraceae bacterium]